MNAFLENTGGCTWPRNEFLKLFVECFISLDLSLSFLPSFHPSLPDLLFTSLSPPVSHLFSCAHTLFLSLSLSLLSIFVLRGSRSDGAGGPVAAALGADPEGAELPGEAPRQQPLQPPVGRQREHPGPGLGGHGKTFTTACRCMRH